MIEMISKSNKLNTFHLQSNSFLSTFQSDNQNFCQICFVQMSMGAKEREKVRLVPDALRLMQKTDMAIFVLTHWVDGQDAVANCWLQAA